MIVITCISQKGGSGKTTLVSNLSVAATLSGLSVGLIDTDPQGSLRRWKERRGGGQPSFASISEARIQNFPDLLERGRSSGLDVILVDTAPRLTKVNAYLAERSSMVLIPVKPRTFDFWAVEETLEVMSRLRKTVPVYGVISEAPPAKGFAENAAVLAMFDAMTEFGIEYCPTPVRRREAYDLAGSDGKGVQEFAGNSKGAIEIGQVWRWVAGKADALQAAS